MAVELKELDPATAAGVLAEVDLLYVDLALWEPVVDAPRLLGAEGLASGCSSPMSQALGELAAATRWTDAVACLHRIDRVARNEVAVVPLWQLRDCFAYRKGFEGIKARTLSLYQNVRALEARLLLPDGQVRTGHGVGGVIVIFLLACWAVCTAAADVANAARGPVWELPYRVQVLVGVAGRPELPVACRPPWPTAWPSGSAPWKAGPGT